MTLDAVALRVLGSLMEKEMTTPELYPLSVNSLVAACNQKSSRDPVLELAEDEVRSGLNRLQDLELVTVNRDGRVPRFEHRIRTVLNLRRDETAVLCLLILRGAQTTGELRGRSGRMFPFEDTEQAQAALDRLAARPEPLAVALPKAPGSREPRYMHLLGDPSAAQELPATARGAGSSEDGTLLESLLARLDALEGRVRALEGERVGHEQS